MFGVCKALKRWYYNLVNKHKHCPMRAERLVVMYITRIKNFSGSRRVEFNDTDISNEAYIIYSATYGDDVVYRDGKIYIDGVEICDIDESNAAKRVKISNYYYGLLLETCDRTDLYIKANLGNHREYTQLLLGNLKIAEFTGYSEVQNDYLVFWENRLVCRGDLTKASIVIDEILTALECRL